MSSDITRRARLGVEGLERRDVLSVTLAQLIVNTVIVRTDNLDTKIRVEQFGGPSPSRTRGAG